MRENFFGRFGGDQVKKTPGSLSELQRHLDGTVDSIYSEDAAGGNGGHEMLQALRGAFRCVHPEGTFSTVESYLASGG